MEISGNYGSAQSKQTMERSEFIRRINEFAHYIKKEYIENDDGDMGLLICAGDRTIGNGQIGMADIMMGGKSVIACSLKNMMSDSDNRAIFDIAGMAARNAEHNRISASILRRRLRTCYIFAGVEIVWMLCLIALLIAELTVQSFAIPGVASWAVFIPNVMLMAFTTFQTWSMIRDIRRSLKAIKEEEDKEINELRDLRERMERTLKSVLGEMIRRRSSGDDDEE